MNQEEQFKYQQDLFAELDNKVMPWDDSLRSWYVFAIQGLKHASVLSLNISQGWYPKLLLQTDEGLAMSTVQILCNNILNRIPSEMGYSPDEWINVLELNTVVARRWNALSRPVEEMLQKRNTIMNANKIPLRSIPRA